MHRTGRRAGIGGRRSSVLHVFPKRSTLCVSLNIEDGCVQPLFPSSPLGQC
jgi:hypothetical protein